jgi:hypothetical protein
MVTGRLPGGFVVGHHSMRARSSWPVTLTPVPAYSVVLYLSSSPAVPFIYDLTKRTWQWADFSLYRYSENSNLAKRNDLYAFMPVSLLCRHRFTGTKFSKKSNHHLNQIDLL